MKIKSSCATFFVITLLSSFPCLQAQVSRSKQAGLGKKSSEKQTSDAASGTRRDYAVSLLSSLAVEAQMFDSRLRSHVQAQVANLLWDVDKVFARDLFLKAWEAAETADNKVQGAAQQDSDQNSSFVVYPREARREVIFLALQKDHMLGEQLLAKMAKQDEKPDSKGNNTTMSSDIVQGNNLSPAELDRIDVARQLLENGEANRAAQFVGEVLNRATISTLRFLSELRLKDVTAADRFYVSLLSRAVTDPAADSNTVSLLSSYIFSPYLYVRISRNGFPVLVQTSGPNGPVDISPNIRSAFLSAAAQILLRPASDATSQRVSYMVATRLLPLFDQFNRNLATQIRSRLAELSMSIPPGLKSPDVVNKLRKGVNPTDSHEGIQDILDRADHLTNSAARDRFYIQAAVLAAEQGDDNAKNIVQEISSQELRNQVRAYVFMALAKYALANKRIEKALEFARTEDLTSIERVWIYIQATELIGTKRATKAIDVVLEAVPIARRIASSDPDKARALVGIGVQLMKFNPELANEYVTEAIMAANKADNFSGEDTTVDVRLETPLGEWAASYGTPNFALKNLFRELVQEDFFQAINMANNLKGKEPRSLAMIAIAQSTLDKSNTSAR
jgi:hypothetical protein